MVASFRPIEALAGETTARRPDGGDIDSETGEPCVPIVGHDELIVRSRDKVAASLHLISHENAQLAGHMVIAPAAKSKLPAISTDRNAMRVLNRSKRGKLLDRGCHPIPGNSIISMPTADLNKH